MPEVISIFVLTGNDDFLVHVAVRDTDHLHLGTSLRPGP
ncbi:Lrp/AsnC ligand binding domain-containing protein [Streptomyces olivochromogenes]